VKTIIIGAGIAGLACARRLQDAGEEFILISKDVGGRIAQSKKGEVNFGAYLISEHYKNVEPYVKITRPINIFKDCTLHDIPPLKKTISLSSIKHSAKLFRFYRVYSRFVKEYALFKKQAEHESQRTLILQNKFLKKLYLQPATALVKELGAEEFAQSIDSYGNSLSFSSQDASSAFGMLQGMQLLFAQPTEFVFDFKKLTRGFEDRIRKGKVTAIKKKNEGFEVHVGKKKYLAKHVVIAVPLWEAKKLVPLDYDIKTTNINMFLIKGRIKKEYSQKPFNLFPSQSNVSVIAKQRNGEYLVCGLKPDFKKYFHSSRIIEKKIWKPAFVTAGLPPIESKLQKGLYLIGDYNIIGLEDAFITGIYAANCIHKQS